MIFTIGSNHLEGTEANDLSWKACLGRSVLGYYENNPVEEVRNREDFAGPIEHPTSARPQVKLPGHWESTDATTVEGGGGGGLKDGEIDDAVQLDGTDLGDVELEDLLELEEEDGKLIVDTSVNEESLADFLRNAPPPPPEPTSVQGGPQRPSYEPAEILTHEWNKYRDTVIATAGVDQLIRNFYCFYKQTGQR
ncbi:uncharacterized protein LY89DRAFT_673995 [Mollisia scopiformis]|uniref:Uncharacterized protein n=1 Tax=Mollisia scopiformis TaxID=149040 RepID=A0A194WX11_MOLSC|nr:uncharacterized protein LY89DRAFT_673995 [Mollisia scopiformis]KUJ12219.1 hypothetical protein LY89DRAFT_673995 [Mollisia scopiformis]